MKLYNRKLKRNIERQVHFGVGNSVKTACGLTLFSRRVMVSIMSDWDGAIITDDLSKVTCKRCLAVKETRLRKLIAVEKAVPGVFDRTSLCGDDWLLEHGLSISQLDIDAQTIEVKSGQSTLNLSQGGKGRKKIIREFVRSR